MPRTLETLHLVFVEMRLCEFWVWLASQHWLQGVTQGTEEARSQLCTCSVLPRAEDTADHTDADLAGASPSLQRKGVGALGGPMAPLAQRQRNQILPGIPSAWAQVPGSANASLVR